MNDVSIWSSKYSYYSVISPFRSAWSIDMSFWIQLIVSCNPVQVLCRGQPRWGAYLVDPFFESLSREEFPKLGHTCREGGGEVLQALKNSNFLIFQGDFFGDLGGNETSASSARIAIRMCISGLCRCGRGSYNWSLPWCHFPLRSPLTQPSLKTTSPI